MYHIPITRVMLCREGSVAALTKCGDAASAADLFTKYAGDYSSEVMLVMCLNTKRKVISISPIHIGSVDSTMCKPRDIFTVALLAGASTIILGHNHPSGEPDPSDADVETTFQLAHAGSILGVNVLDHIVFTQSGSFVSLKEKGYL